MTPLFYGEKITIINGLGNLSQGEDWWCSIESFWNRMFSIWKGLLAAFWSSSWFSPPNLTLIILAFSPLIPFFSAIQTQNLLLYICMMMNCKGKLLPFPVHMHMKKKKNSGATLERTWINSIRQTTFASLSSKVSKEIMLVVLPISSSSSSDFIIL